MEKDKASEPIILYGSYTCPMVTPVRNVMDRANATYDYINISRDSTARARVREINDGNESVPTLEFPDGSTLTEPSISALKTKLDSLGYTVSSASILDSVKIYAANPIMVLVAVMTLILGLTTDNTAFSTVGIALLIVTFVGMIRNR